MKPFLRRIFFGCLAALAPVILALQPAQVDAQTQSVRPPRSASPWTIQKERMNAWTVGLPGAQFEGAPIRFAAELARVVEDGPNMLVLPIVTRGPVEHMNALL